MAVIDGSEWSADHISNFPQQGTGYKHNLFSVHILVSLQKGFFSSSRSELMNGGGSGGDGG